MREVACTRYLEGGWRLALDADELLDYPESGRISLRRIVRGLDAAGWSGVVAQMLDMVPKGRLNEARSLSYRDAVASFRMCSTEDTTAYGYHCQSLGLACYASRNRATSARVGFLSGGLRRQVFGENCLLTKHPLFRASAVAQPMPHPHITTGLTCAPFSFLIRLYKFAGDVVERESLLLAENRLAHGKAALGAERFSSQPDLSLEVAEMREMPTFKELEVAGFWCSAKIGRPSGKRSRRVRSGTGKVMLARHSNRSSV
jgi:hypothetical protein